MAESRGEKGSVGRKERGGVEEGRGCAPGRGMESGRAGGKGKAAGGGGGERCGAESRVAGRRRGGEGLARRLCAGGGAGGARQGAELGSQPDSVGREGGRQREPEKGGERDGCQKDFGGGQSAGRGQGARRRRSGAGGTRAGWPWGRGEGNPAGEGQWFEVGVWGEEARAISCLQRGPSSRASPPAVQYDTHLRPSAGSYSTSSPVTAGGLGGVFLLPSLVSHHPPSTLYPENRLVSDTPPPGAGSLRG